MTKAGYGQYMGGTVPAHAGRRKAGVGDQMLLRALGEEGDCVETRAIFLSWLRELRLGEMILVHWRDVDLAAATWRIAGEARRIPSALMSRLCKWQEKETGDQLLLRGLRSQNAIDPKSLSKRVSFFLARHQLEFLSLIALRGKGTHVEGRRLTYNIVRDRSNVGGKTLSEIAGISISEAQWYLDQLVREGKFVFVKRKGYLLLGFQEAWAIVKAAIATCKEENCLLLWRELLKRRDFQ